MTMGNFPLRKPRGIKPNPPREIFRISPAGRHPTQNVSEEY